MLTGNSLPSGFSRWGSELTDRFGDARWRERDKGTGAHPFDQACQCYGVRHKLTHPYHPQTNSMVDPRVKPEDDGFNRRLAEALDCHPRPGSNAGRNRFSDPAERNAFILTFVRDYNRTRLRCLGHKAPAELLSNLPGTQHIRGDERIKARFNLNRPRPSRR